MAPQQGDLAAAPCAKMPAVNYFFDGQQPIDDEHLEPADKMLEARKQTSKGGEALRGAGGDLSRESGCATRIPEKTDRRTPISRRARGRAALF